MNDAFGFTSVGLSEGGQTIESQSIPESTETPAGAEAVITTEAGEAGAAAIETPGADDQSAIIQQEAPASTATTETPISEPVYVDPFKDLGETERSIFESIKSKDYKALKDVLEAITTDYDQVSDIDLVRRQLKESKPRWTDEMIDSELGRKYGLGFDESELNPQEALIFKMQLLDDADSARALFKSKQAEIKFPDLQSNQPQTETQQANQLSPEQAAEFKKYWESHINNSVQNLTDEVIQIEVGKDGSKESFEFPISITDSDKNSLKTLVSDFDINKDFQERYVKDNVVDLKKFMGDRFKAENFDKLLKAAFAQGHSQGKLGQIKADKNLDGGQTHPSSSTHDQISKRTLAADYFFSNGRKK